MTAILRTAKQSADVLGTLKLHIGIGLDTSDTEDNSLDIQIRIAEIDAEFKAMLQAIATDTVEDFDEQRAAELMAEKSNLEQQLAQYANVQQKEKTHNPGWMKFLLSWRGWKIIRWSMMTGWYGKCWNVWW